MDLDPKSSLIHHTALHSYVDIKLVFPSHRSKLIHAENITMFPTWMNVGRKQTVNFTLIFTGLPRHCKQFDLIEKIPEEGGFVIKNIERNNTDVYLLDLT